MRVLIADDHAVVRAGLKQILVDVWTTVVVGEAKDAHEALRMVREQDWDVVVLDISMPGKSGIDVLKELKQGRSRLPVLVLTSHSVEQYAVRVMRAGAAGYMTKESAPEHLIEAIRKVMKGGKYISPQLAEVLVSTLTADTEKPPHEILSDREYQVLRLIALGKTVGEIASELFLSDNTISTYRARILEKLGMKTTAELIYYAIKNGLID
jgi:two-component system, NarL family, invasion response regulator UvrY